MKNLTTFLLLSILILVVGASAQTKKYDIKSGIVTFETAIKAGSMTIPKKVILYFDDYGMKECKETYEGDKLAESYFSDGKSLYKVIHADKTAYKAGDAFRGTELKFDWNEVSAKDKKDGTAKKLPDMTVAGKTCQAFQVKNTTFAGWSGITLLTEMKSKSMSSVSKAVKVEENAKVPAAKFAVPAGYAVQ